DITLPTVRASHQYATVIQLCRVHLKPYRNNLRLLFATCYGKRFGSKRRTPNIEHRISNRALCIRRWVFDVRCLLRSWILDARFSIRPNIHEGCSISPTWETVGRRRTSTCRERLVRGPGPSRSLRDLPLRCALSSWHFTDRSFANDSR